MSKKLMLSCLAAFVTISTTIEVADAKRIGGGRSSGIQRQVTPMQRQAVPPSAAPQQQAAPNSATARPQTGAPQTQQASGWRKWAGPLAGLAAGIGLAALLSNFGIGGEFAGILLAILAVVIVVALLRRMMGGARPQGREPAYAGNAPSHRDEPADARPMAFETSQAGGANAARFPEGFDAVAFERQAKVNFIRLQAANDAGNLTDIRDFTSPEMFAEIKLDIDERKGAPQRTDVVMLDAEVLEVTEESGRYIASVHFSGSLREENDSAPQAFSEIWHLVKPINGSQGWTLAGVQQSN
jgi:predicted lipid-binding transport protein (Tim44 family)